MIEIFQSIPNMTYALSWAIVHSLWQSALIYCILRILLRCIPDNHSRFRYTVSVLSLFSITGWFIATFIGKYSTSVSSYNYTIEGVTQNEYVQNAIAQNSEFIPIIEKVNIWLNSNSNLISIIYILGISIFLIRILFNLSVVKQIKSSGVTISNIEWNNLFDKCVDNLNIKTKVKLLFSSKVDVPMVMGSIKPVVLMPIALVNQLSIQEAEAIILHELAHVKRNDYLINMIQLCIEAILFFSPFIWFISTIIRREREKCCDDTVVVQTNNKIPYVKALAVLEEFRQSPTQPALAAKNTKNYLLTRIKRIMEMRKKQVNYAQLVTILVIITVLLSSVTFVSPVVNAQSKGDSTKIKKITAPTKVQPVQKIKTPQQVKPITKNTKPSKGLREKEELEKEIEEEALKTAKMALSSVNTVLEELDLQGILQEAFESVDWEEINEEMKEAFEDVDWDAMKTEIEDSFKAVDWDNIRAEMRESMSEAKATMAESKKEMLKARKELLEAQKELAAAQRQIAEANRKISMAHRTKALEMSKRHQAMAKRNAEMAAKHASKARKAANKHDKLLSMMEQDGLINKKKGYKIEKQGRTLYIDNIKQSNEVYKKYAPYMNTQNMTIKGKQNSITIKTED